MPSPLNLYDSYLLWLEGDEDAFLRVYEVLDYIFDRCINRILRSNGSDEILSTCNDSIDNDLSLDEIDRMKLRAWTVFNKKHKEIRMEKCEAYFDRVIRGEYANIRKAKNRRFAHGEMLYKVEFGSYIKNNDIGVFMSKDGDVEANVMVKLQSKINDADNSIWRLLSFDDKGGGDCECSLCKSKRTFGQLRVLWSGHVKCKGCAEVQRKALMYEARGGKMEWFEVHELGINISMPTEVAKRLRKSKRLKFDKDDPNLVYHRRTPVSIGLLILFRIMKVEYHKRSTGSLLNALGIPAGSKEHSLLTANFKTYAPFIEMLDYDIVRGTKLFRQKCRWIKQTKGFCKSLKGFVDKVNMEVK